MFFVWPNNQIDIRQVNRRKTNLISYVWESKDMKLSYSQGIETYMPFGAKGRSWGVWDLMGRKINPRDIGRTNIW